jgi:XTP/dITP diphosphohydrolase
LRQILTQAGALGPLRLAGAAEFGVDPPLEDGLTFTDNALIKARAVNLATGRPALADDSGLCVEVLGGSPGVFSARWAGGHGDDQANLELLLDQLRDVTDSARNAYFECAAALVRADGSEVVATGRMTGRLARQPRGKNGFGYDPILLVDGLEATAAELPPEQKNQLSHRGRAFRALAPAIRALWDCGETA